MFNKPNLSPDEKAKLAELHLNISRYTELVLNQIPQHDIDPFVAAYALGVAARALTELQAKKLGVTFEEQVAMTRLLFSQGMQAGVETLRQGQMDS